MFFAFVSLVCALISAQCYALRATDLSIEDRVGQLLMVWFDGEDINEEAYKLLSEARVGSIIYYRWANGLKSPQQIKTLSDSLQSAAHELKLPPLLIAIDEEGGVVSRLNTGFTDFPGNGALGRTEDPHLTYLEAQAIGKELKSVGVNYNLSPVVDINNNPDNPIIGIRSFGSNPSQVTEHARAALHGYLDSGIIPCLKHFPGHGDVTIDSHDATPIVNKPLTELTQMELQPYLQLSKVTPSIMTVHILFPHLDPFQTATVSPTIVRDLLRYQMEYEGVVITDSLTMHGASKENAPLEQTALEAFLGGNDILLTGGASLLEKSDSEARTDAILKIYNTLLHAVYDGTISESHLNQSVNRILKLKDKAGLFSSSPPTEELIETTTHHELAKQIAYRSVEISEGVFPLSTKAKRIAVIAPNVLKKPIEKTILCSQDTPVTFFYFDYINPSEKEITDTLNEIDTFDHILFFSYNAWIRPKQLQFLETIATTHTLSAHITTGDAKDLDLITKANLKIATYSPSIPSLQVATEYIIGRTKPLKISPEESLEIGMKIWMNTSKQSTCDLTCWKDGEEFPSLGIGHFTWPPYTYRGPFSKGSFHELITFLQEHNITIPSWIEKSRFSPWTNHSQFTREIQSENMRELRALLCNTMPLQARFMCEKINESFLAMLRSPSIKERKHIIRQFFRIAGTPKGPYILTDYLNFQHSGVDPKERYNNLGWGLMQALQNMKTTGAPIEDFITSATSLLIQRVQNAPPERQEDKSLPIWLSRLATYR